ncbi:MAG: hypothetical protein OIN88_05640 [Candidatus Methanoperedens sp.]|nr:hypothetical protein [Candidatus Methanoperedens sp.]MCZ7361571.1 hypothetical protein [Candidatus Methanoperedens sp.]HLB71681.1 hypothetical protein [Candidatus Methanoperedens sp.]
MAFKWPHITDKFTAYEGDKWITHLSVALWLVDDYTKKEPISLTKVKIKEGSKEAFRNLSGYHIFTDLASGNHELNIESGSYFSEKRQVDTSRIKDVTLEFDDSGPPDKAVSTELKDASKLEAGDIVEFHNPRGDIEQRRITNIVNDKTIFWIEKLKYSFSAQGSTIRVLKYLIEEILLKPKPSYLFPDHATLVRGLIYDSENKPIGNAKVEVENEIETVSDHSGEFVLYFTKINGPIEIKINEVAHPNKISLEKGKTVSLGKIVIT